MNDTGFERFGSDDRASLPLVSIVMPAYNAERYLPAAVNSILAQSYPNWELIIVDDASTDQTPRIARDFQAGESRVKVISSRHNRGVTAARNLALENASGKYVAFLDSDDEWYPEKLRKQVAFMESESVSICYSSYLRVDENDREIGRVVPPARVTYADMLKSNFIGNLTGIYNAQVLGKEYFQDFRHEDYVAWLELVKRAGGARGLPEVLARYRVYAGSTSSNKFRTLAWQWRIYRNSQSLGFFRSCLLMVFYANHALYKRL